ncbi:MAG: sulfatase [Verrucomicrobia bacterium]|nr:sulfatase [Verrucomicrobiota bacterium]
MKSSLLLPLFAFLCVLCGHSSAAAKPNILVIVADDLGYADVGFNGCKDIPTPNLDALAKQSLRCTSGYVSHPFCSPTRAGLLTGRYQQRFGHENNPAWLPESTVAGLPLSQTTLPQVLKTAGYATAAIGKWHLGAHPQFHPNRRGFDDYVGMLGGGHIYLPGAKGGAEYQIPIDRNGAKEELAGYLTEFLGREAAGYINQHKGKPWFLYLAFNAPHTPLQITDALAKRAAHIADETRRGYAGLVLGLDDAVGVVTKALKDSGQTENTLVFFFSDNGGPISVTHSDNTPLRGAKGAVYEGGMRVPFLVSWPGKLAAGKDYAQPVISLDVFPTAAALAGVPLAPSDGERARVRGTSNFDGVNLFPFLTGEKKGAPHDRLFWRTGGGAAHAVRQGDWKLVKLKDNPAELYNLASDIGESKNLAPEKPDLATQLQSALAAWDKELVAPIFESPGGGAQKKKRGPAKVEKK